MREFGKAVLKDLVLTPNSSRSLPEMATLYLISSALYPRVIG